MLHDYQICIPEMLSAKDLFIEALMVVATAALAYILFSQTPYPALALLAIIPYMIVHILVKQKKKIAPHLKEEFRRAGYEILSERPLKLSESKIEVQVSLVTTEPMTYGRWQYVRRYERCFVLRNRKGERFEWHARVTYHWDGRKEIEVRKKTKLEGREGE